MDKKQLIKRLTTLLEDPSSETLRILTEAEKHARLKQLASEQLDTLTHKGELNLIEKIWRTQLLKILNNHCDQVGEN